MDHFFKKVTLAPNPYDEWLLSKAMAVRRFKNIIFPVMIDSHFKVVDNMVTLFKTTIDHTIK